MSVCARLLFKLRSLAADFQPLTQDCDGMNRGLLYRRVVDPILELMSQGLTPEKIALSLAFGIVLGVFPMLGSTTILCAVAALIFRLNLPSIQLVNYLIYPLQFLLLIPFLRLGEKLFHAAPLQLSVAQMLAMAHADLRHAIATLWLAGLHAMSAWLLIGPLAIWLLYFLLSRALRKIAGSVGPRDTARAA